MSLAMYNPDNYRSCCVPPLVRLLDAPVSQRMATAALRLLTSSREAGLTMTAHGAREAGAA